MVYLKAARIFFPEGAYEGREKAFQFIENLTERLEYTNCLHYT